MSRRVFWFLVLCIALLWPGLAQADRFQTFAGNNTNGPRWQRPIGDGPQIDSDQVRYQAQRFQLAADSLCYILSAQEFDGYIHLYKGSFNANDPLTNLVDGDDDAWLAVGTSRIPDANPMTPASSRIELTADTYVLVTSGFDPVDQGAFQTTIHCDGDVQPIHGACAATFTGFDLEEEVCLQDRYIVAINWNTATDTGKATPVRTGSSDTGMFWFFNDRNWEVMVKVLNGCPINNHYWVFIGALTNQGYTVSVGDSQTLQVNAYSNPRGTRAAAVADTTAFPCN